MKKVLISLVIIVIVVIVGIIGWYTNGLKSVTKQNSETITVEIKDGMGVQSIANLLEKNNVIKSATVMNIYAKLNNINNLKKGKYDFNNSEDLARIH